MNNLIIPPSANWYETSILSCAPDNTLLYGSRTDIVIIYNSPDDQPADVKIIPRCHSQRIISTSINKNWGQPHKLLVTAAEDNIVKLWDIEIRKKKLGHNAHVSKIGHGKIVGATFAGDNKVISVTDEGVIVVWNITLNQTNLMKDVLGLKVNVTCISTCPHANWLTAFGLKNGLVVVTDLRKHGKVLYKLRGHDKSVLSLAWCPVPVNIFPKDPTNYVGTKSIIAETEADQTPTKNVDTHPDATEHSSPTETMEKPKTVRKNNIWANLKHVDDDENVQIEEENTVPTPTSDFLEECQSLKTIISGQDIPKVVVSKCESEYERVIIKAKRRGDEAAQKTVEVSEDSMSAQNELEASKVAESSRTVSEELPEKIDVEEINKTGSEAEGMKSLDEEGNNVPEKEELQQKIDAEVSEIDSNKTGTEVEGVKAGDTLDEESETKKEIPMNVLEKEELQQKIDAEVSSGIDSNKTGIEVEEVKTGDASDEESNNVMSCGETKREIPLNLPEKEEPRREFLLASSGKEGNIYIWRAGTDGRMQTLLSLPNKSGQRKSSKSNYDKLWVVLCWVSPTLLLSSSRSAEMIKWTLPKPKDKFKQYSVVHNDHNSILFSIAAPIIYLNENNWLEEKLSNAWTVGHDRLLLNTSLTNERKNLSCYPTLGNAECFALSPVDPNRLAIGTAEGAVKVWDLSRPNIKHIVMSNFFQKIQSKVAALAWHPTNELILAYATSEGRVGCFDTNNKSKAPTVPPNFFTSQIHRIEWGPIDGDKENLGLFAVGEGKLVVYTLKKSENRCKSPTEVDVPDNTSVYTFAWKPDYSMLMVGTKTGSVIIYSTELKILSTHYIQHRLKDIYWHPDASLSDPDLSEHCFKFAAVSNSKDVIVCDFNDEDSIRIVQKYELSEDVINCITWNSFTWNELVIAGDDGTVHVWNFDADKVLSTYVSPHFEGILSVICSPINSDCIISAAKDHTIRVWSMSEHPEQDETEIKAMRKKVHKEIISEQNDLLPKVEKPSEEVSKNKSSKKILLPNFFHPKEGPQVLKELRKLFLWKEGLNGAEGGSGDSNCDILKIFGSKNDMLSLVEENETTLQEKGKYNLRNTLSLFKGDISTRIKKAVEERTVTPWIIMMAPMVSPKLWQSACLVYAQQLSEIIDSDPIEIATYYLACHEVEEAINVLCDASMFREAFVLAKCRLPEDSPTLKKVTERWIKYSITVGNFEAAAQCYIYLGKYEDAASVLFRRSDVATLEFAKELAEKSGNEDLHKAVLVRYNGFKNEEEKQSELQSRIDVVLQETLKKEVKGKEPVLGDSEVVVGLNGCESKKTEGSEDNVVCKSI